MADPIFNPRQFGFDDWDFRIEGMALSPGPSLSGIEEPIRTDGGGYVAADFANGVLNKRESVLAWRAVTTAMDGGVNPVTVILCDRRHQPVVGLPGGVPHSDLTPFSDGSLYTTKGASGEVQAAAALRAVELVGQLITQRPLIGGEWFSILHPTWGHRAYNIMGLYPEGSNTRLVFRPPLREALTAGTAIELDTPRCRMRRVGKPSNPVKGRIGAANISFVEDMRKPA